MNEIHDPFIELLVGSGSGMERAVETGSGVSQVAPGGMGNT